MSSVAWMASCTAAAAVYPHLPNCHHPYFLKSVHTRNIYKLCSAIAPQYICTNSETTIGSAKTFWERQWPGHSGRWPLAAGRWPLASTGRGTGQWFRGRASGPGPAGISPGPDARNASPGKSTCMCTWRCHHRMHCADRNQALLGGRENAIKREGPGTSYVHGGSPPVPGVWVA
jgi:hypothetical protein